MEAFNAELQGAGAWVFAGGLEPHPTAVVVTARDGGVLTTDGPFAEGKEHIGGFWVIDIAHPRVRAGLGRPGQRRLPGPGGGPPVPAGPGGLTCARGGAA